MKTMVSDTSIEAYHSLPVVGYLQPKEKAVLAAFNGAADTFTRQQLAERTGIAINAVCGRTNSLIAKKALCVRGSRIDPATHKRQELLGLPVAEQSGLFDDGCYFMKQGDTDRESHLSSKVVAG